MVGKAPLERLREQTSEVSHSEVVSWLLGSNNHRPIRVCRPLSSLEAYQVLSCYGII